MDKKYKTILIAFWALAILVYIANIVVICVRGEASLANGIMGWSCCVVLALSIISNICMK